MSIREKRRSVQRHDYSKLDKVGLGYADKHRQIADNRSRAKSSELSVDRVNMDESVTPKSSKMRSVVAGSGAGTSLRSCLSGSVSKSMNSTVDENSLVNAGYALSDRSPFISPVKISEDLELSLGVGETEGFSDETNSSEQDSSEQESSGGEVQQAAPSQSDGYTDDEIVQLREQVARLEAQVKDKKRRKAKKVKRAQREKLKLQVAALRHQLDSDSSDDEKDEQDRSRGAVGGVEKRRVRFAGAGFSDRPGPGEVRKVLA